MTPDRPIFVVCEGESDRRILGVLIQRILREEQISRPVQMLAAGGKQPIPYLIRALEQTHGEDIRVVIVIDSDLDARGTRRWLARNIDQKRHYVVIADPFLEAWLGLPKYPGRPHFNDVQKAWEVNLVSLSRLHPEFGALISALKQ